MQGWSLERPNWTPATLLNIWRCVTWKSPSQSDKGMNSRSPQRKPNSNNSNCKLQSSLSWMTRPLQLSNLWDFTAEFSIWSCGTVCQARNTCLKLFSQNFEKVNGKNFMQTQRQTGKQLYNWNLHTLCVPGSSGVSDLSKFLMALLLATPVIPSAIQGIVG